MVLSKEISFLHRFSDLIEQEPEKLEYLFTKLIDLLPRAMTHRCSCTIIFQDVAYGKNEISFYETSMKEEIITSGRYFGYLIIGRNNRNSNFTQNESELIKYVCKRLGRIIERYENKQLLNNALVDLEKKNKTLEIKNIAMRELLNNFQENEFNFKQNTIALIQSNIMPNLHKLEEKIGENYHLESIKLTLSGLMNEEEKTLFKFTQLSQRELECCYLINKGFSSKEIAEKLFVSSKTVDKHRANIRQKLDMVGSKKNLYSSLKIIAQTSSLNIKPEKK